MSKNKFWYTAIYPEIEKIEICLDDKDFDYKKLEGFYTKRKKTKLYRKYNFCEFTSSRKKDVKNFALGANSVLQMLNFRLGNKKPFLKSKLKTVPGRFKTAWIADINYPLEVGKKPTKIKPDPNNYVAWEGGDFSINIYDEFGFFLSNSNDNISFSSTSKHDVENFIAGAKASRKILRKVIRVK